MKRLVMLLTTFACAFYLTLPVSAASNDMTPSGIPLQQMENEIDSFVNEHLGKSTPGAAVTVVKDGEIIFSKGYGYADVEKQIEVDPQKTIFEYGSISKLFVWTAAMQLVEQGKLDLNEDIKTYLPEDFASKLKFKNPITMNQIMSHTAGFEDVHFDLLLSSPKNMITLEEALLENQPEQIYEPGSTIAYSNYSTALAGFVIEQISGQSFSDYERNQIFLTSQMTRTSGHPTLMDHQELEVDKAIGYMPNGKGDFTRGQWTYVPLYPAGSVNGTAEDLARYMMALMPTNNSESPLFAKNDTLDEMLTQSYTPHKDILSNAHGFWEFDGKVRGVGHGGNTAAFSTNMVIVPEEKMGVVVLTNASGEMHLTYGLMDLLLGQSDKVVAASTLELPKSEEVEGLYIGARQSKSSYTELLGYLTPLKIKAIGENQIQISVYGIKGTYTQISPHYYVLTSSNDVLLDSFQKIYFEMSENKVTRITNGQITDYLPLEGDRQLPLLLSSLAIVLISLLYFIVSPFVILIKWFKNRNKKGEMMGSFVHERRVFWACSLSGTVIILNNVILLIRSFASGSMLVADELKVHLYMNWAMLAIVIVLIIFDVIKWNSMHLKKKEKYSRFFTFGLIILLLAILINWNFFNIII